MTIVTHGPTGTHENIVCHDRVTLNLFHFSKIPSIPSPVDRGSWHQSSTERARDELFRGFTYPTDHPRKTSVRDRLGDASPREHTQQKRTSRRGRSCHETVSASRVRLRSTDAYPRTESGLAGGDAGTYARETSRKMWVAHPDHAHHGDLLSSRYGHSKVL